MSNVSQKKLLIVANTAWYIYNFRLPFLREVQKKGIKVFIAAPSDSWSEKFAEEGMAFINISMMRRGLNPIIDAGLMYRFFRLYKDIKPDIVFHNTIKPVIYGTYAAHLAHVSKIINMIPGLGYIFIGEGGVHHILQPLVKFLYRNALKYTHRVYFQNPDDASFFLENRLVELEKIIITPGSGVDLDHFYFVQPTSNSDCCSFLYSGRLIKDKGILEYVEAAKQIKSNYPKARFIVIGKIDKGNPAHVEMSELHSWISENIIEYYGELDDVRETLKQCDVVVLPSYREGVPKSIIEGMAMGKAVITTDAPGCRETIVSNRNGILVAVKDTESLVSAMRQLIENPTLRISMGIEARKVATEKFDVKYVNNLLLQSILA